MDENIINDSLSLVDLIKIMLRRWWVFVIAVAVFVTGGLTYTKMTVSPLYASRGTIYISNAAAGVGTQGTVNLTDVMLAQELVSSYTEILSSNSFMKRVAEESGLGYNYRSIKGRIRFSQKGEAPVMLVEVISADPKEAHILAETVLNNAQEEVNRVIPGGIVEVIDHAEQPTAPFSPNYRTTGLTAAVVAIALTAVVIFCIEYFDDRIKSRAAIEYCKIPVLAEIPYVLTDEEKEKQSRKKKHKKKTN